MFVVTVGALLEVTLPAGKEKVRKVVVRGGHEFRDKESPCAHCRLQGDLGKKTGTSAVQKSRQMGKNQEDEYMIISNTKEQSRKKPGFGHSRLARRPAAGLMKHLQRGTFASATKKMCLGSADVPGPPEQNNDIITISVTDQTVHKVTGEGRPVRHTLGGLAVAQDGCGRRLVMQAGPPPYGAGIAPSILGPGK